MGCDEDWKISYSTCRITRRHRTIFDPPIFVELLFLLSLSF